MIGRDKNLLTASPASPGFVLRPATAADQQAIRRLVRQARINPTGLDWPRFTVAVDEKGQIIGCGQVKPHGRQARELASIVVALPWRGRGVARQIIQALMGREPPPLWLVCRSRLVPFYVRFGFRRVDHDRRAPGHFQRLLRIGRWLNRLAPSGDRLAVMVWEG